MNTDDPVVPITALKNAAPKLTQSMCTWLAWILLLVRVFWMKKLPSWNVNTSPKLAKIGSIQAFGAFSTTAYGSYSVVAVIDME